MGSGSGTLTVTIQKYEATAITTTKLPNATLKKAYTEKIELTGTKPDIFELQGTLPNGLTFNSETGEITGKPKLQDPGKFPLTAKVINVVNGVEQVTDTREFTLMLKENPPKKDAWSTHTMTKTNGKIYPYRVEFFSKKGEHVV